MMEGRCCALLSLLRDVEFVEIGRAEVGQRMSLEPAAQQVNKDFQSINGGALPEHATVVPYATRFDPIDRIQAGGSSSLSSDIKVVDGTDGVHPNLEEEITLFGPDGQPLKRRSQAGQLSGCG